MATTVPMAPLRRLGWTPPQRISEESSVRAPLVSPLESPYRSVVENPSASYDPFQNVTSTNTVDTSLPRNDSPQNSISECRLESKVTQAERPLSYWWWWEILAIILSLACMGILVSLLAKMDNTPLQSWWLPIEPNSLIAALATVAKASMLIPVASCVDQLVDLQLFDGASRGPWRSAVLLWCLCFRVRVLITCGFAMITIVALGIDTSAQQVLTFSLRESPLNNVSAKMGVAHVYRSKGFPLSTGNSYNSELLALQASVINGTVGSVFQPYFTCPEPASRCQWDVFTTIGVCANFTNVTEIIVPRCSQVDLGLNCTYSFPAMDFDKSRGMVVHWRSNSNVSGPTTLFQSQCERSNTIRSLLCSFVAVKSYSSGGLPIWAEGDGFVPPPAEVYWSTFSWCTQTFHYVASSSSGVRPGTMLSEDLIFIGDGDYNLTEATGYDTGVANSTGLSFRISVAAGLGLSSHLNSFLNTYVAGIVPEYGGVWSYLDYDALLDVKFLLLNSDIEKIRSKDPGDNPHATTVTGTAFFNETYIHVVLTTFLLVVSIVVTRNQPLLKKSTTALLMSRLEGWADHELDVPEPQTQEKFDDLARKMVAKLEVDDLGRLKFLRK
ncbi:hypothetical protein F4677DRAFT_456042 [Hypoxylon crocopeplum]|nr:hypothetical protein F4677DRAFT_456042 [Hypoxylon crocopeplum]